jgi:tetratricopeptide (TPR) repeat protein
VTGRHFSDQRTADGLTAGLPHFERALELDGKYALAYAGLADTYIGFATFRVKSPNEAYVKAKEAALRALKIDPDVSEAHSALAMVSLYHEWNWDAAEREFTKAIRLNPEDTAARQRYALALAWFERFDDALREMALAREADPVSPLIRSVGQILYFAGRYEEAIQELDKALVLERNSSLARNLLGITYVATGAFDRAIAEFRSALESGNPEVEANLAHAYAVSGRTDEARKILDQLLASSAHRYVSPFDIAIVYAGLGERDTAFMWLDKAFTERTRTMLSLRVNPRLAPLRSDSRFTTLVRRTKIFDPR